MSVAAHEKRTSWKVTRSVWYALFMREAIARTMADRLGWFWMIAEPTAMIAVMLYVRTAALGSSANIAGAGFIEWMVVGLFGFMLFRENMMQSLSAINSNKALFSYRQVKPIDPVLVRCYLEGILKTFIFVLFIMVGFLLGIDCLPDEPLGALFCWFSLWCLGLGISLVLSALTTLIPEIGKIVKITTLPLLIISGVIMPINFLPHDLIAYLLWNPILHGLESMRESFFTQYRSLPGISLQYIWGWNLVNITCGLMLHLRFEMKLKSQ